MPDTSAPSVSDAMDTVGGVVSTGGAATFETVNVTAAEVFELPAASNAATLYEYVVAAVSPVLEYVVDAVVPIHTPSRYTSYPTTPTLSVEAVQERSICDSETVVAPSDVGVVGACVSVIGSPAAAY